MNRLQLRSWIREAPSSWRAACWPRSRSWPPYSLRDAVAADAPASRRCPPTASNLLNQTDEEAAAKSAGCVSCHKTVHDPHDKDTLTSAAPTATAATPRPPTRTHAHVPPRFPEAWPSRPTRCAPTPCSTTNRPEFIRFVNPGDLRIAHISCGTAGCHPQGGAANPQEHDDARLHAVGRRPLQQRRRAQQAAAATARATACNGVPQRLQTVPPPTEEEISKQGRRALPRPAAALRDHPAGQHPPHLRARRQVPARDRHPRPPRKTRAGRS